MDWNHICFFPFIRKLIFSRQDLKIISKGFETDSPQILSIRILTTSWPRALLESRSWIILAISLLLNNIDEIIFFILFKNVKGSMLELFIKGHCSAKKELNISAFSLKSFTYLFCWLKGEIQGFFYCWKTYSKLTNRILYWSLDQPT